jgi:hypothetical protein
MKPLPVPGPHSFGFYDNTSFKRAALVLTTGWTALVLLHLAFAGQIGKELSAALFTFALAATGAAALVRFAVLVHRDERNWQIWKLETIGLAALLNDATASGLARLHALEAYWCNHPGKLGFEALDRLHTARNLCTLLERRCEKVKLLLQIGTFDNLQRARALLLEPLHCESLIAPYVGFGTPDAFGLQLETLFESLEAELKTLPAPARDEQWLQEDERFSLRSAI